MYILHTSSLVVCLVTLPSSFPKINLTTTYMDILHTSSLAVSLVALPLQLTKHQSNYHMHVHLAYLLPCGELGLGAAPAASCTFRGESAGTCKECVYRKCTCRKMSARTLIVNGKLGTTCNISQEPMYRYIFRADAIAKAYIRSLRCGCRVST